MLYLDVYMSKYQINACFIPNFILLVQEFFGVILIFIDFDFILYQIFEFHKEKNPYLTYLQDVEACLNFVS